MRTARRSLLLGALLLMGCSAQPSDESSASRTDQSALEPTACDAPISASNDPNAIHGDTSTPFFEGWYYRVIDTYNRDNYIVIVAYARYPNANQKGFIQVSRSSTKKTYVAAYDVDVAAIQRNAGTFDLTLGGVRFTASSIKGSFTASTGERIDLDLAIAACRYWGPHADPGGRVTMGWALEKPGVLQNWHVNHMRALGNGTITIAGTRKTFANAYVHQEKNWGGSFPAYWIWMQANTFRNKTAAVVASGGPIFGFNPSPEGYMAGIRYDGNFYSFRTQDGDNFTQASYSSGNWYVEAYKGDGTMKLVIQGDGGLTVGSTAVPIYVPNPAGASVDAAENLSGHMTVALYRRQFPGWESTPFVFLESDAAALEAGGSYYQ